MNIQAFSFVILLGILFGSSVVASRFMLGQIEPITYTALRLLVAGAGYLIIYMLRIRARRWPTDRGLWKRGFLMGIVGDTLPVLLIVSSMQYQSSGVTSTLVTIFPVVVVILAHFFLPDEPLTRRKIIGMFLAVLMAWLGETGLAENGQPSQTGYLMILGAALTVGFSTIYARKYLADHDTMDTVSIRLFSAALFTIPFAIVFEGFDLSQVTPSGYMITFYGSFVFFVGFFLGFYVLQRFGATISAMSSYVSPVIASIGGMLLLN
ncbi:MAG: DMT family transporter [Anaerolineaceae bacterium]|nr:DMT family transporter [Anaerolineaceae bacterium]